MIRAMEKTLPASLFMCLSLVGCSTSPIERVNTDPACLKLQYLKLWQILDKRHVIAWLEMEQNGYLITLSGDIPDVDSNDIRFVDFDGNGKLCGYGGDRIAEPKYGYNQIPATVASVHKLDDEELAALSQKYHTNLSRKKTK